MSPIVAYLLYALCALGGVAIYLGMPRGRESKSLAGGVLGLAVLAFFLVLMATSASGSESQSAYFYLFSAIAIASAARVITHRKPVYSALYFVLTVIAVAALMVLRQAEFLAIALIIIYAGAILVTYLFVIMLAQAPGSPIYDNQAREPLVTVFACFLLLALILAHAASWDRTAGVAMNIPSHAASARLAGDGARLAQGSEEFVPMGHTLAVGWSVMTKFVVALELAGVLLLVSMVGAITMSRRRVEPEVPRMPDRPLGEIGKEVPPF